MTNNRILSLCFVLLAFGFSLFSFTLVDLNLTLLNWTPYLTIQSYFTQLGYFNRVTNGYILLTLLILLFLIYPFMVLQASRLSRLLIIGLLSFAFSYNAFSYDLFNYMFDARVVTKYSLNPYQSLDSSAIQFNIFQLNTQDGRPTAQSFPDDEWTRFMHWTHRPFPYGPGWLLVSLIPSLLGFQKFLLTFVLFKLLFLAAYLLSCWSIYHIALSLHQNHTIASRATALYAFQPLVLIDGLLSPHLDNFMGALALFAILLALQGSRALSAFALLFSASIKFATFIYFPFINSYVIAKFSKQLILSTLLCLSLGLAVLQATSQSSYQPWYGLLISGTLPLLTGYVKVKYLILMGIVISLPMWVYVYYAFSGVMLNAIPLF